ncbi:MAG: serine protease [Cellvibrionaceae bacterium]
MRNYFLLFFLCIGSISGSFADEAAQRLYSDHQSSIYRIEVIKPGMEKKASLGTGFLIGRGDVLASNFHVISSAVHEPDRYKLEWVNVDGERGPLEVLAVDVVHDLSLLKAGRKLGMPLATTTLPDKGTELYSLGHPLALDLSIVSGTMNGLLEKSIYEKIHFSGSVNPGMSGGPTLDAEGRVVGVNVASAGNSVGFLVPVFYLDALLQKTLNKINFNEMNDELVNEEDLAEPSMTSIKEKVKKMFVAEIGEQLIANQEALISEMLANEWPLQVVGKFQVPGEISNRLDCWAEEQPEKNKAKYRQIASNCNGQDSIFLSQRQRAGTIDYQYFWFDTKSLSTLAFYNLYQQSHSSRFMGGADETDVGNFTCSTKFITISSQDFKVNVCARPYLRYPELTDFMVLMAMVGHDKEGFMFTLDLSTVTLENGMRLFERFLEQFTWID